MDAQDWPDRSRYAFSPDGKWIVTTGNFTRLWDGRNGKQMWEYRNKAQSLSLIGFVDDSETVVLRGDSDGAIYILDRANGTEKRSFPTAPTSEYCEGTVLSPDGSHIVLGGYTSKPRAWDLTGKELAPLEGHKGWIRYLAFSPDGMKLYAAGNDPYAIEREVPSGKALRTIDLGRKGVQGMAVSPDGKRLEVVFWGEQLLIFYDLETGKKLPEPIDSHRSNVYGVECDPNGSLVTFGRDSTVRTCDLKQGKSVAQFAVEPDINVGGFALSADGKRVAVPNADIKSIGLYERLTGKRIRNIPAEFWARNLVFSPDARFLAAIDSQDCSAQVWDVDTGDQVLKFKAAEPVSRVTGAFSPDGRTFAFGDHGQVRMWDTATWKEGIGIQAYAPLGLDYSPDGRMIATASVEGVRLYEVATRRERAHVRPDGHPSGILRFSHNGRLLAWVNDRNTIHVLDVRTGVLAGPFTGHDDGITGLAFTIDDKALASSSGDSTILIWDASIKTVAKKAPDGNSDADWQALRGEDAQKAFTAIRALAAHPETALKIASEHLKPAEPIDPKWVAARLRDLDNEEFAERERATRELEEFGDRVAAALEKFLATKPSVEATGRAEKILAKLRSRDATEQVAQSLRALEVLEWTGSAKARELVEKLAKGAEGVSLTEEAKSSLKRWKSSAE